MIEVFLLNYLLNKTEVGANVFCERPENVPDEYILIEKTGTSTENMITTSTIAVQSISNSLNGGSMFKAMSLNEDVKKALLGDNTSNGIIEKDNIVDIELQSDYNFTDTESKEYRYQAVFNVTHYQEA